MAQNTLFQKQYHDLDKLHTVRKLVSEAAEILRGISPDHERVAWLLEDSLEQIEYPADPEFGHWEQPETATFDLPKQKVKSN
ncbi:hypothetical protein JNK13_02995 [bacterium]|nr:hypothetical protein [bacterium]